LTYRAPKRRNGCKGPGPFTLEARREILHRLEETQNLSGYSLIDNPQLDYIKGCWGEDENIY
jgi:DNA sulfur modification protein DndC